MQPDGMTDDLGREAVPEDRRRGWVVMGRANLATEPEKRESACWGANINDEIGRRLEVSRSERGGRGFDVFLTAAVRALQTCLLLRPNWAPAYRELTTNLAHLGRRREAVQAYEALLRLMPDALEREQDFAASVSEAVGEYGLGGLKKAAKWAAK
jgi:tetratricopeptide (TPR) repeat protein